MTTPTETYPVFLWNLQQGDIVSGDDFPRSVYLGFIHENLAGGGGISLWWNVATSATWTRPMLHSMPIYGVAIDPSRAKHTHFERVQIALGLNHAVL